jgi:hypothetical protein
MRTLGTELQARQKAPPWSPVARVTASAFRPSWAVLASDGGATPRVNDMVVAADGAIVRAYVSGSAGTRTIYTQRITDPEVAAQWNSWTSTVTGVDDLAVALARLSDDSLRLFYSDGGSIRYRISTDHGATWGAEQTAVAVSPGSAQVTSLASATGLDIFYTEATDLDLHVSLYSGGAWGAVSAWTGTGQAGMADVAKVSTTYYVLLQVNEIRIDLITFDGATWANQRAICPVTDTSFGFYWPRIWYDAADSVYPATTGAFRAVVVRSSLAGTVWDCLYLESDDGLYWTTPARVPLPVTTDKPVNVVYIAVTNRSYVADNKYAYEWAVLGKVELGGVKRLEIDETGYLGRSRLRLYLDNRNGAYSTFGQAGAKYQALERGSRLKLEVGLGGLVVTWGYYYVDQVRLISSAGHPYECRIAASNGRELLNSTTADVERVATDDELQNIVEYLCALAGVHVIAIDSADDFWTTPHVANFSVKVGSPLLTGLANLVGPYGYRRAYVHFDRNGVARLETLTASPAVDFTIGPAHHPIWAGLYGRLITPDQVTVLSLDSYAESYSDARLGLHGRQAVRLLDKKLPTATDAGERAAEEVLDQDETAREGYIIIPPALGLELWDVVQVTDAGGGLAGEVLRVVELELVLDYEDGSWYERVGLRGTT